MEALICNAVRTPVGRHGWALASVRTNDLAALPIRAMLERNQSIDWAGTQLCAILILSLGTDSHDLWNLHEFTLAGDQTMHQNTLPHHHQL